MKKLIAFIAAILVAASIPATANSYAYFDWAWGYPYEQEFHQNRWWSSDTLMAREQVYVELDRCLPEEARLLVRYRSASGGTYGQVASPFGGCRVHSFIPSNGAAYVEFRIEYWDCTEGWSLGHDCGTRIAPQGNCWFNVYPWQGCPGGYKWYRLYQAWAYSNIGGCSPACQ